MALQVTQERGRKEGGSSNLTDFGSLFSWHEYFLDLFLVQNYRKWQKHEVDNVEFQNSKETWYFYSQSPYALVPLTIMAELCLHGSFPGFRVVCLVTLIANFAAVIIRSAIISYMAGLVRRRDDSPIAMQPVDQTMMFRFQFTQDHQGTWT